MLSSKTLTALAFAAMFFWACGAAMAQEAAPQEASPAPAQPQVAPDSPAPAPPGWFGRGPWFVDRNRDGVCDRIQGLAPRAPAFQPGPGRAFGRPVGPAFGPGRWFVDRNRDGVCDRLQGTAPPAGFRGRAGCPCWNRPWGPPPRAPFQGGPAWGYRQGPAGNPPAPPQASPGWGRGRGPMGNPPAQPQAGPGWGRGRGPGFVDRNNDGICDYRQ